MGLFPCGRDVPIASPNDKMADEMRTTGTHDMDFPCELGTVGLIVGLRRAQLTLLQAAGVAY